MSADIEYTKTRIHELEVEIARLSAEPVLFSLFDEAREAALDRNTRSLRSQQQKLKRLEAAHAG